MLSDPERRALYDRYGKAGLQRGGFEPAFADFGSLADVFAAFFGEDLLGGAGSEAARAARRRRPGASSRSSSRRRSPACRSRVPLEVARAVRALRRDGRRAGDVDARAARRATAPASSAASRRTSSASSSSSGRARTAAARARCSSSRAPTAAVRGGVVDATSSSRSTIPRGIHDGQQIRVRGEGHAGFRSTERGNAFVVVRVRPDPRFVRDGDDLHTARAADDDGRRARHDGDGRVAHGRSRARGPARHPAG